MGIDPEGFRSLVRAVVLLAVKDIYRAKRLKHKELPIFEKKTARYQRTSKRKKIRLDYDSAERYLKWLFEDEGFKRILRVGKKRNWRCAVKM